MPDITLEDLKGLIRTAVDESVATHMKDGQVAATAELNATREKEGATPEEMRAAMAKFSERVETLERENKELARQVAEQRFSPVLDEGGFKRVRWPLQGEDLVLPPDDEATRLGQKINDELYTLSVALRNPERPLSLSEIGDQLKATKHMKNLSRRFGKAIDTVTAGSGLEWVPQGYSSQMIDAIFIATRVAGLFASIPMPTKTYTSPVQLGRPKAYHATEGSNRTQSSVSLTAKVSFDAEPIAVYVPITQEATEDLIIPIIAWTQAEMAAGMAEGIEACIMNGDTTATHMDHDIDALGADAVETCWDGLRHYGMATEGCAIDLATCDADHLLGCKKALGKYGIDPTKAAIICGPDKLNDFLLLRDANNNLLVTTIDKYGAGATVLTGEVGKLFGTPVVPSAYSREDVAATGYNTVGGPNTKKTLIWVCRSAWVMGDRKQVTLESQKDIVAQVHKLVASWRGDFQHVYAAGEKTTTCGYNMA